MAFDVVHVAQIYPVTIFLYCVAFSKLVCSRPQMKSMFSKRRCFYMSKLNLFKYYRLKCVCLSTTCGMRQIEAQDKGRGK